MYSKEELKKLKTNFWTSFGQFSQLKRSRLGLDKKWMLYKTKLKGLELKFDFIDKTCITTIEVDINSYKANDYITKLELLKEEIIPLSSSELITEYLTLKNKKDVYRIFYEKENISLKKRENWPTIFEFFFDHMLILEQFIIENKEILEQ